MNRVGVLALQGDVPEHRASLAELLPDPAIRLVRTPADLSEVEALILPGGESTTIARLMESSGLARALPARAEAGLPMLATCAGLIVAARELEPSGGGRDPPTLGLIDVKVHRNDYGRQRESFEAPVRVRGIPGGPFPGVFIRAPRIVSVGEAAEAIAFHGSEVVGVRQGSRWGLCFHPELSEDPRVLRAFLVEAGLRPRGALASPTRPRGAARPTRRAR